VAKGKTVYDSQMVWLDIETTGTDPTESGAAILELGITVTDLLLEKKAEKSWVVNFDRRDLAAVSDWSIQQHYASGLLPACFTSQLTLAKVEAEAQTWLRAAVHFTSNSVPMCGASIHFDRSWLKLHMPLLEKVFYYGNFDVSTIEKIARWWWPNLPPWEDKEIHRALPDNDDAIAELLYYAQHGVINLGPEGLARC
jgi:oligoribonuclease